MKIINIIKYLLITSIFTINIIFLTYSEEDTSHYENISSYSQASFHPNDDDFFGRKKDEWPICKIEVEKDDEKRQGKIALTFDSAYYNNYTYKILDILDTYDAKATFFMTTDWMMDNKDQVLDILKRGHEIGNHSWHHKDFTTLSNQEIAEEVMYGHKFFKDLTGIDMSLFRFPYGSYDERTITSIKNLGYYPIQWTFDSIDWKNESVDKICKRFDNTDKIEEGAIVLMHNGAKYTPDALPHIFELLENKNLKCVKVSDLIYTHDFKLSWGKQSSKK